MVLWQTQGTVGLAQSIEFIACPHCGTAIHPIASRCKYCRCDVREARPPVDEVPPVVVKRKSHRMFLLLGFLAACGGTSAILWKYTGDRGVANAAPEPSLRPAPTPTKPAHPFAAVVGKWHGVGHQYEPVMDWDIVMTIEPGDTPTGKRIGTIEYPSLGCSGELIRLPEEGNTLVVQEQITNNPEQRCVPTGTIRFTHDDDKLEWKWFFPNGNEGAKSRLSK